MEVDDSRRSPGPSKEPGPRSTGGRDHAADDPGSAGPRSRGPAPASALRPRPARGRPRRASPPRPRGPACRRARGPSRVAPGRAGSPRTSSSGSAREAARWPRGRGGTRSDRRGGGSPSRALHERAGPRCASSRGFEAPRVPAGAADHGPAGAADRGPAGPLRRALASGGRRGHGPPPALRRHRRRRGGRAGVPFPLRRPGCADLAHRGERRGAETGDPVHEGVRRRDIGSGTVPAERPADTVERLTTHLRRAGPGRAVVRIEWERTGVSVPIVRAREGGAGKE